MFVVSFTLPIFVVSADPFNELSVSKYLANEEGQLYALYATKVICYPKKIAKRSSYVDSRNWLIVSMAFIFIVGFSSVI